MTGVHKFVFTIVALVLLEAVVVGIVVFVPNARQAATQAASDIGTLWFGSEDESGYLGTYSDAADRLRRNVVQPLFGVPDRTEDPSDFTECVSCHSDYATRTRYAIVYMDHPVHAELGIECATCHTDIAHPLPLPPSEDVCAECHEGTKAVGDPAACTTCHPPGRLTHYQLAGMKERGSVNCNACHLPGTLGGTATHSLIEEHRFDGTDDTLCTSCHEVSDCASCHGVDHPDDWIEQHGPDVLFSSSATCNNCHSGQWCAGACHDANTLLGNRLLPLPYGGNE